MSFYENVLVISAAVNYVKCMGHDIFLGMMDALDQSVGAIFEYLSDAGMLHNTIFVYTTDNGGAPVGSDGGRGFNWPLRGTKGTLFEGGVKAGAFIWSPLIRRPRRLSKQMMHIVDWMVTLYSAAGQYILFSNMVLVLTFIRGRSS